MCGNDDFYSVLGQGGCTLHATLTFTNAEGDLDLYLERVSDGSIIGSSTSSTAEVETIDFTPSSSAGLALRVAAFESASNSYRLHVETDCP